MPRGVSLSNSKCWNGGHEWVKDYKYVLSCVCSFLYCNCTMSNVVNKTKKKPVLGLEIRIILYELEIRIIL